MRNLQKKLKKQGGFTLVEMLIVVAIIAILVAVSIPIITVSLQKTRHATDLANERAAKMEIMAMYLSQEDATLYKNKTGGGVEVDTDTTTGKFEIDKEYAYDATNGVLLSTGDPANKYGKCECNGNSTDHVDEFIKVKIDEDGIATVKWSNDGELCSDVNAYDEHKAS